MLVNEWVTPKPGCEGAVMATLLRQSNWGSGVRCPVPAPQAPEAAAGRGGAGLGQSRMEMAELICPWAELLWLQEALPVSLNRRYLSPWQRGRQGDVFAQKGVSGSTHTLTRASLQAQGQLPGGSWALSHWGLPRQLTLQRSGAVFSSVLQSGGGQVMWPGGQLCTQHSSSHPPASE